MTPKFFLGTKRPHQARRAGACHCLPLCADRDGAAWLKAFPSPRHRWTLVRCIGPWDGDEAGDIPIYRRGRSPSGRYPTARAQMRCRRGVWRPRAAQPSARPRSNCRDRPLLCREAHVHEGQQWTTRWWLRIARSVWPFLPKKKKGRNTFLLHRRCVFVEPSIFLFFSQSSPWDSSAVFERVCSSLLGL